MDGSVMGGVMKQGLCHFVHAGSRSEGQDQWRFLSLRSHTRSGSCGAGRSLASRRSLLGTEAEGNDVGRGCVRCRVLGPVLCQTTDTLVHVNKPSCVGDSSGSTAGGCVQIIHPALVVPQRCSHHWVICRRQRTGSCGLLWPPNEFLFALLNHRGDGVLLLLLSRFCMWHL